MTKRLFLLCAATALLSFTLAAPSFAGEKSKEMTITGEGMCAKCKLHETDKCQNVIQVEKKGKKVNYYLADNDVSKEFHGNLCKAPKKVTATGTVKTVDGKKEFTATKLKVVADEK